MNVNEPLIKWGWLRAVLYFFVTAAAMFGMQFLNKPIASLLPNVEDKVLQEFMSFLATYAAAALVILFITWIILKLVDKQPFLSIGFSIKEHKNEAGIGLFAPLFLLSFGSLVLIGTGHLAITGFGFSPVPILLQMALMIVVAFTEEIMFRGYLLNNLMHSMNKWVALGVSALLFALVHLDNPDITWVAFINVLLAGLVLGANYVYTRNLWYSIAFHFIWNFFQGAVLGYDVSGFKLPGIFSQVLTGRDFITGGKFGFEGSFVCFVLLLITAIVFYFVFERKYSPQKIQKAQ